MADIYSLPLKTLAEEFDLQVEFASTDFDTIRLTVADVARPGLLLAGFFEHFDARRLQVLGRVEMSYLSQLSQEKQEEIFDHLFAFKISAHRAKTSPIHPSLHYLIYHNSTIVIKFQEFLLFCYNII